MGFLCVEPPPIRDIDDSNFKESLKDVRDDYSRDHRKGPVYKSRSANRSGARDGAAEMALGICLGKYSTACGKAVWVKLVLLSLPMTLVRGNW